MSTVAPTATRQEYYASQLASWYPTFSKPRIGRTKGVTLKSVVICNNDSADHEQTTTMMIIPPNFGSAFLAAPHGVRLPTGVQPSSCLGFTGGGDPDDDDSDDDDDDDSVPPHTAPPLPKLDLTALTQHIDAAIQQLGGRVVAKTNWSAPRDAVWINEGTLQCQTAGDVYLLLQASDFCQSDVQLLAALQEQPPEYDTGTSPPLSLHIVLRKWCQLHASHEFRCFVRQHRLVALTQRHTDQYFDHIVQDRDDLLFMVQEFFTEVVQHQYADGAIPNYVMDVYIDRQDRVWIVDFNIWGDRTDALLFEWDELNEWPGDKETEFRMIETAKEILPQALHNYRAPVDTVYLAGLTGGNPDKFQAFMDLCQQPSAMAGQDDSSSDDENA